MSFCSLGDTPTLFYKFKGQSSYSKVTFSGIAPIDVQIQFENITSESSDDSEENKNEDEQGICYPNGAPALGTFCGLTYYSWMDWWTSDRSALGEGGTTGASGGGRLPEDALGGSLDAGYNYGEDGWFYRYSYQASSTQETDEDGTRYKYYFVVEATKSIQFDGQPPTEMPSPYEAVGDAAIWGLVNDTCGWNGNPNCSMSPPPPPPPLPPPPPASSTSQKNRIKIKVLFNGEIIWMQIGEAPANYRVSCQKNECPPGFMKLKSTAYRDFCCIECEDLKQELAIIKLLVRQKNG